MQYFSWQSSTRVYVRPEIISKNSAPFLKSFSLRFSLVSIYYEPHIIGIIQNENFQTIITNAFYLVEEVYQSPSFVVIHRTNGFQLNLSYKAWY